MQTNFLLVRFDPILKDQGNTGVGSKGSGPGALGTIGAQAPSVGGQRSDHDDPAGFGASDDTQTGNPVEMPSFAAVFTRLDPSREPNSRAEDLPDDRTSGSDVADVLGEGTDVADIAVAPEIAQADANPTLSRLKAPIDPLKPDNDAASSGARPVRSSSEEIARPLPEAQGETLVAGDQFLRTEFASLAVFSHVELQRQSQEFQFVAQKSWANQSETPAPTIHTRDVSDNVQTNGLTSVQMGATDTDSDLQADMALVRAQTLRPATDAMGAMAPKAIAGSQTRNLPSTVPIAPMDILPSSPVRMETVSVAAGHLLATPPSSRTGQPDPDVPAPSDTGVKPPDVGPVSERSGQTTAKVAFDPARSGSAPAMSLGFAGDASNRATEVIPIREGSVSAMPQSDPTGKPGEPPQSTQSLPSLKPDQHIRVPISDINSNRVAGPAAENERATFQAPMGTGATGPALPNNAPPEGGNRSVPAGLSVLDLSGTVQHTNGVKQLSPAMTQNPGLAMEAGVAEILIQNSLGRREFVASAGLGETRLGTHSPSDAPSVKPQGVAKNLQPPAQPTAQAPGIGTSALTEMPSDPLEPTLETGLTLRTEMISANTSNAPGPVAQPRSDLAASAAKQLADALPSRSDRQVEIALNPDELGSVRMRLVTGDAGVTVSILAERPETMDLLRRHIDQLASEFRKLGYESIGFDFAGSGTGTGSGAGSGTEESTGFDERTDHDRDAVQSPEPDTQSPPNLPTAGLDLRV